MYPAPSPPCVAGSISAAASFSSRHRFLSGAALMEEERPAVDPTRRELMELDFDADEAVPWPFDMRSAPLSPILLPPSPPQGLGLGPFHLPSSPSPPLSPLWLFEDRANKIPELPQLLYGTQAHMQRRLQSPSAPLTPAPAHPGRRGISRANPTLHQAKKRNAPKDRRGEEEATVLALEIQKPALLSSGAHSLQALRGEIAATPSLELKKPAHNLETKLDIPKKEKNIDNKATEIAAMAT